MVNACTCVLVKLHATSTFGWAVRLLVGSQTRKEVQDSTHYTGKWLFTTVALRAALMYDGNEVMYW